MAYLEQLRHVAGWLAKGDLWPDWEQESYPEFRDLALIPVFAVLFPTARFFLDKFVFEAQVESLVWICGGFYTYSIFALMFWETRRADFGVSMSHHIAAVFLVIFSYLARFARVGSVVLAIHDASDVFLEIGKLTKYYGLEIVPSIAFVIFAISWVVFRLIYFPFHVIWSTSYEVLQLLNRSYKQGPILYYIFNTLLISLFVLHIYWWVLIFRMIVKQVEARGRISDDVRSDSDDDDDEGTGKED